MSFAHRLPGKYNLAMRYVVTGLLLVMLGHGSAYGLPRTDLYTDVGLLGLAVTNLGYVGDGFQSARYPSGEYPINSNVECIFLGGLWVGAETLDERRLVTTGAQDASTLQAGEDFREFGDYPVSPTDSVFVWSDRQNNDNFDGRAIANQHIDLTFTDVVNLPGSTHVPLGLRVHMRILAWGQKFADDFVLLEYNIINISPTVLSNVYVGYWTDTTVGNTDNTNPYDKNQSDGDMDPPTDPATLP